MHESYSQHALDGILAGVRARRGWDFSGMSELRQPAPWDYRDVALRYLRSSDTVLDVGTGAGERLRDLAPSFGHGLGIDADPQMVRLAREAPAGNLSFRVCSERLESVPETFDVILDRHAPFGLDAIAARLRAGGYFITQQVGERNMACVKAALGQAPGPPPVSREAIAASGLHLLAFMEYDAEYVVLDIGSLVFWLNALDAAHADVDGQSAVASAAILNRVLAGNVDERGFVTNAHRYLAIAQSPQERPRPRRARTAQSPARSGRPIPTSTPARQRAGPHPQATAQPAQPETTSSRQAIFRQSANRANSRRPV